MATGVLLHRNLFLDGTIFSPVGWLDLANLLTEEDYVGSPARCLDATDLAKTQFELVMPEPRVITFLALLFHTLSLNARYRITGALVEDTAYAAPTLATGWRWVYPSLYDPEDLDFGVENFWTGTVTAGEIDLLGRHLYAPLTPALVQRVKVEIDDQLHPLGWFDIGGVFGAAGFTPVMNFDRGRDLSIVPRDRIVVAPSGRRFFDPQRPMRVLSLSYSHLTDAEGRQFIDIAMARRSVGTVIFVPDVDDVPGSMREAFPATFAQKLPSARSTYRGLGAVPMTFEEIIA